jgi:hypothetical protein
MLDSKFFFTIVGLLLTVFAICNTNTNKIQEGFLMSPRKVKVERVIKGNNGHYHSMQHDMRQIPPTFSSRPDFQANLSPRFNAPQGLPATIRYNIPSREYLASPNNPLGMANMAKEGYNNYGSPRCNKNGTSFNSNTGINSNISDLSQPTIQHAIDTSDTHEEHGTPVLSGMLQTPTMDQLNADGTEQQVISYDRYIYANQKSRLYAQGDPIRGDLNITPCKGNWFNVHPNPGVDLQQGALAVMGGKFNEMGMNTAALVNSSSGGVIDAIGGQNMSNVFDNGKASAAGGDVQFSAFV